MAAFLMAAAVQDGTALGEVLGVLIIVVGNAVAIILEGIIASVQTVRLEYYEFFSKFFSGEGRPFKPFCLSAKGSVP
jgi:V/A-type H+/Na+-transporting ATPase subunit I